MSINQKIARSAFWTISIRLIHQAIGIVSTAILARLLVPEDFGLVAMASLLVALLAAFSELSVQVPLIQKRDLDRVDMDSAWSLQLMIGFGQAGLLILLAQPAATFFSEDRLELIVYVLAATTVLKGTRNIGTVMFQREMTFNREFRLILIQRLCSFFVTIVCALAFRSYWALIAGIATSTIADVLLSYGMHPYRPKLSAERWGPLFRFSKWLLVNNLLLFFANRLPDMVLGKLIGPRAVGLFSVGYQVSTIPTTHLVAPINRAVLPAYSQLSLSDGTLKKGYLDVTGVIAMLAVPAGMGIAATASTLVPLVLGPSWTDAIPIVNYIAIAGALGALLSNNGSALIALGRPRMLTVLLACRVGVLVPAVVAGSMLGGTEGVALAYLSTALVDVLVNIVVLLPVLRLTLSEYLGNVYRPILASAIMYVLISWCAGQLDRGYLDPVIEFIVLVSAGVAVYGGLLLSLWGMQGRPHGAEKRVIRWTADFCDSRFPGLAASLNGLAGAER